MAWQIYQDLTTAHLINKTLAVAKCQTPGTKLYIRTAPSESKCIKRNLEEHLKAKHEVDLPAVTQMIGSHAQYRQTAVKEDAQPPPVPVHHQQH